MGMDALLCLKGFSNPSSIMEKLIFFIKEVSKFRLSKHLANTDGKRLDGGMAEEKMKRFRLKAWEFRCLKGLYCKKCRSAEKIENS